MTDVETPAGQEEQRAIKLADFLDDWGDVLKAQATLNMVTLLVLK